MGRHYTKAATRPELLQECENKVCIQCNKPAEIWSLKQSEEKKFWCSFTCKEKTESDGRAVGLK